MRPVIRKSEVPPEHYPEYLEKHFHRNIWVNAVDVSFFNCAISVVSITVVLPAFLRSLHASNLIIGLLPCLNLLGAFLPQLFASYFIEGLFRKKPYVLALGVFQRLPFITLGISVPFLLPSHPGIVAALFFTLFFLAWIATGFISPAWAEMIAKAIPQKLRGTFMGGVFAAGNAMALMGGLLVGYVMGSGRFPYPVNYAALFLFAFCLMMVSYAAFFMNREPVFFRPAHEVTFTGYLRNAPGILRSNANYRYFVMAFILSQGALMGNAFYMVYAMERFQLTDAVAGKFVIASTAAMVMASILLGRLADRRGHRLNLIIASVLNILAPVCAVMASRFWHMMIVFVIFSGAAAASAVSTNNIIFELAPPEKRPTYLGLMTTLAAPFVVVFSLSAGKLADNPAIGYHLPFYLSCALNVVCFFILVCLVKDPRSIRR